ncbi:Phosphoglycerate dehydrogenase [Atopostipes suicloacalis DSM 15692]|uniref:Phosphoglycerate dehydrogenase n=1 Tax=Atopostipes suicloacalis DSM 15692 TaxID=1121025 RepID=A0A1M4TW41_9LACT|nr:NAD(P)-dependent oxidoreductase [Atopostipes suicloacalis]SHE48564.1 Phosphoglycerate dehydrogenase [Atopostipes suicloacalis DSM 15692]
MTKSILVIQELYSEQLKELKEKATDYNIVESIEETGKDSVEIIIGWSDELIPLIENDESKVKWVQFAYAGVNDLPLELFAKKNILLTNGSGIHANPVTESTIGLLLGLTRSIVQSAENQKKKRWKDQWENEETAYELAGKTMLIVGAGKIGVQLGRVAKAFHMDTIGINRSGRKIENMDEQYTQKELAKIIHKGDIIVNILPLTKETTHLYDETLFSKMKEGVVFINVGRGESVDTSALMDALDHGKVRCAGLDVFEEEPLPENHPLWGYEQVLMTPHIAGRVESYPKYIFPIFMKNFEAYVQGEELPENLVKLDEGY